jgi:hypothetical protein
VWIGRHTVTVWLAAGAGAALSTRVATFVCDVQSNSGTGTVWLYGPRARP